jgi:hypothetical protein
MTVKMTRRNKRKTRKKIRRCEKTKKEIMKTEDVR